MESLSFSNTALGCIALEMTGMILLPCIVLIIMLVKKKLILKPMFIGAATFFVFAIILKIPLAYLLFQADNPVSYAINHNPWLYYLAASLMAGVFEETGRFIAFKVLLKKDRKPCTDLSYALGHGGYESIYLGFSMISVLVIMIMVNNGQTDTLTQGLSPEQTKSFFSQLSPYADLSVFTAFLGIFERMCALTIHTGLSLLVYQSVTCKTRFFLFPVAILIHSAFDFIIVFTKFGLPLFVLEMIFAVISSVVCLFAFRLAYPSGKQTDSTTPSEKGGADE